MLLLLIPVTLLAFCWQSLVVSGFHTSSYNLHNHGRQTAFVPHTIVSQLAPPIRRRSFPSTTQNAALVGDDDDEQQPAAESTTTTAIATTAQSESQRNNATNPLVAQAQLLKERAIKLRAEAQMEETSLKLTRSNTRSDRIRDADAMIERLFQNNNTAATATTDSATDGSIPVNSNSTVPPPTTTTTTTTAAVLEEQIATIFRTERWSPEQAIMVLERLHERQCRVQDQPAAAIMTRPSFQIADYAATNNANAAVANETEWRIMDSRITLLINAASLLDDQYNDKNANKNDNSNEKGTVAPPVTKMDFSTTSTSSTTTKNGRWTGRVAAALKTRRKELVRGEEEELKRKIAYNVNAVVSASKRMATASSTTTTASTTTNDKSNLNRLESIQEYTRQTLGMSPSSSSTAEDSDKNTKKNGNVKNKRGELNMTRVLEQVAAVPLWVPSSLLPMLVESRATLRKEDVSIIKNKVLVGSRFFCTSSDAIPSAAVFRGNIRTPVGLVDVAATASNSDSGATTTSRNRIKSNHTAVIFEEIQERLKLHGDLHNRVQLFLLEDQEWRPGMDERAPKPLPVILAISKKVQPTETIMEKPTASFVAKQASSALTVLCTFCFSVSCYALNPIFFDAVVKQKDLSVLLTCIPLCLGVLLVQWFHEAAHYAVAKARKITVGRPTPLPSPQIGTFGCITPLLSFPSNRKSLFDLALSGPLVGIVVSLIMMYTGIQSTIQASDAALSLFPVVPMGLFKCSLLTSSMLSSLAPKLMMLPPAQPIPVHPLLLSGFAGLISSALNLLPVFRLDGGRIVSTLFGPRVMGVTTASTLLFMLSLTISGSSNVALTWGLLVVFLQRRTEVPVRDDVTPVNDVRLGAWIGALGTALLALFPVPGGVFL